ncbi:MAG: hypothetical protein Q9224_007556, partial [Gallowayella concinna]
MPHAHPEGQPQPEGHICCPETTTSHPDDPIPSEPKDVPQIHISSEIPEHSAEPHSADSSANSLNYGSSSNPDSPATPATEFNLDNDLEELKDEGLIAISPAPPPEGRRTSDQLIPSDPKEIRKILGEGGENTRLIEKVCCGEGCCKLEALELDPESKDHVPVVVPDNDAFRSLKLKLGPLSLDSKLTRTLDLPAEVMT